MGNLFGLRTPYRQGMMAVPGPIVVDNDAALLESATRWEKIVADRGYPVSRGRGCSPVRRP
jgi:hypothetical protein